MDSDFDECRHIKRIVVPESAKLEAESRLFELVRPFVPQGSEGTCAERVGCFQALGTLDRADAPDVPSVVLAHRLVRPQPAPRRGPLPASASTRCRPCARNFEESTPRSSSGGRHANCHKTWAVWGGRRDRSGQFLNVAGALALSAGFKSQCVSAPERYLQPHVFRLKRRSPRRRVSREDSAFAAQRWGTEVCCHRHLQGVA